MQNLQGTLHSAGQPVASANISLLKDSMIIAYTSSDPKGNFKIDIKQEIPHDQVYLQVGHLAFNRIYIRLDSAIASQLRIELLAKSKQIDAIEIKGQRRIQRTGDTLTYQVSAFARLEDRKIADVLARMPGIRIDDRGKISFNGKEISSLYVDGTDILAEQYSLAGKTIPHDIIQKVEVLQNHQHQRVRQKNEISNSVALNLVVNDSAKTNIVGQVDAGIAVPAQYQAKITSMTFSSKFKMLQSLTSNTMAEQLSNHYIAQGRPDRQSRTISPLPERHLQAITLLEPPIAAHLYLKNNSQLLSSNNVFRIKDSASWRLQVNQLIDRNKQQNQSLTEIYGSDQIYTFAENNLTRNIMRGTAIASYLEVNKQNFFFSHNLSTHFNRSRDKTDLENRTDNINQQIRAINDGVKQALHGKIKLPNSNLLELAWDFSYQVHEENLTIHRDGKFQPNTPQEDNKAFQKLKTPIFSNRFSGSYRFNKGFIKHRYQLSLLNQSHKLLSDLDLTEPAKSNYLNLDSLAAASLQNRILWKNRELNFTSSLETKFDRWEIACHLPVSLQKLQIEDPLQSSKSIPSRVFFNPQFSSKYELNANDFIQFNYLHQQQIANVFDYYQNPILINFRELRRNQQQTQEQHRNQFNLSYNIQRPNALFFGNVAANYSRTHALSMTTLAVTDLIKIRENTAQENTIDRYELSIYASKYIPFLRGTIHNSISRTSQKSEIWINQHRRPMSSELIYFNLDLDIKLRPTIGILYNLQYTHDKSSINDAGNSTQKIKNSNLKQVLNLSYSPNPRLFLQSHANHYQNQLPNETKNYFFIDFSSRWQPQKTKFDLEILLSNTLNIKYYQTRHITANELINAQYHLRGRMLSSKCTFYF